MATCDLTPEEMFESFTGFDEIAVAKAFDADVTALRKKPLTFMRALVFVDQRRAGLNDQEAHHAALSLTLRQVDDYFTEDTEPMPEDPVTVEGKDD